MDGVLGSELGVADAALEVAAPGVRLGADVIAGVGVSGSPGVDEPCVQAGLDKVADQLK